MMSGKRFIILENCNRSNPYVFSQVLSMPKWPMLGFQFQHVLRLRKMVSVSSPQLFCWSARLKSSRLKRAPMDLSQRNCSSSPITKKRFSPLVISTTAPASHTSRSPTLDSSCIQGNYIVLE